MDGFKRSSCACVVWPLTVSLPRGIEGSIYSTMPMCVLCVYLCLYMFMMYIYKCIMYNVYCVLCNVYVYACGMYAVGSLYVYMPQVGRFAG